MIKSIQQTRNEEEFLQSDKSIYKNPIANITLNGEMLNAFYYDPCQQGLSTLVTSIQHCIGSSLQGN